VEKKKVPGGWNVAVTKQQIEISKARSDLIYLINDVAKAITSINQKGRDWIKSGADAINKNLKLEPQYHAAIPGFYKIFCDWNGMDLHIHDNFDKMFDDTNKLNIILTRIFIKDDAQKVGFKKPTVKSLNDGIKFLNEFLNGVKNIGSMMESDSEEDVEKHKEAPADAPFGRIAFSLNRKDKVPFEKNTSKEQRIEKVLAFYFIENTSITEEDGEFLRELLASGLYEKVLKKPSVETVYRGIVVRKDWLADVMRMKESDIPIEGTSNSKNKFTYKPHPGSYSSSWSQTKTVASRFSGKNDGSPLYKVGSLCSVVIHAKTSDNENKFLSGPDGLYNVSVFDKYQKEKEVIGLGDIRVSKIEWSARS